MDDVNTKPAATAGPEKPIRPGPDLLDD